MPESDENDNQKQAEEFAYTTNAVTYILSAARCPTKFRDYIDCLIGVAHGRAEFFATDKQIESRRKVIKSTGSKGINKYWARDKRRGLLDWQKENKLFLLTYEKGAYDSKTKHSGPSHFTLYLVGYVQKVVDEAKKKKLFWNSDPAIAIKQAAQELIDELRTQPVDEPKKNYFDPPTEVRRKLNNAKTLLENAVLLLEKYEFELSKNDEPLVTSIEQLLTKLRERGFADFWDTKIFAGIEREAKP